MSQRQPSILQGSSSLINRKFQIDLTDLQVRKLSSLTTNPVSRPVREFLARKYNKYLWVIEYQIMFRKALKDDKKSGGTEHERNNELKRDERDERESTQELITFERQKKSIEDDIAEGQGLLKSGIGFLGLPAKQSGTA